jgi:hypothetical protein
MWEDSDEASKISGVVDRIARSVAWINLHPKFKNEKGNHSYLESSNPF